MQMLTGSLLLRDSLFWKNRLLYSDSNMNTYSIKKFINISRSNPRFDPELYNVNSVLVSVFFFYFSPQIFLFILLLVQNVISYHFCCYPWPFLAKMDKFFHMFLMML